MPARSWRPRLRKAVARRATRLAKMACIGCAGAFIAFGGTTVVGVAALMIAGLPFTVACLDYCATGFDWGD